MVTSHLSLLSCIFDRIQPKEVFFFFFDKRGNFKCFTSLRHNSHGKKRQTGWSKVGQLRHGAHSQKDIGLPVQPLSTKTENKRDREWEIGRERGLFCFCSHLWCRSGQQPLYVCVCVFAIHFMVTVVWSAEGVSVRFWMTLIAPCMPLKVGYKTQVTAHYLNWPFGAAFHLQTGQTNCLDAPWMPVHFKADFFLNSAYFSFPDHTHENMTEWYHKELHCTWLFVLKVFILSCWCQFHVVQYPPNSH